MLKKRIKSKFLASRRETQKGERGRGEEGRNDGGGIEEKRKSTIKIF